MKIPVTYSTIFVEGYQHFMSFVGIYNTNHGLIAFADSKSTLINEPGAAHDTKRGLINKIFSNSHFICTYHGANALRCNDADVFIEDYFRDHMGDKTAPVFFEELSALVKNKTYTLPSPLGSAVPAAVYFIVGTYIPEISKYALYRQTLSADGTLSTNDYTTNTVALFGGFSAYVDMIAAAPHYSDVPIDEYEQTVKRRAELLIDYVDTFGIYNPAGHPIVTQVFTANS